MPICSVKVAKFVLDVKKTDEDGYVFATLSRGRSGKPIRCIIILLKNYKNPDTNYLIIVPEQFTLQTQRIWYPCIQTMGL